MRKHFFVSAVRISINTLTTARRQRDHHTTSIRRLRTRQHPDCLATSELIATRYPLESQTDVTFCPKALGGGDTGYRTVLLIDEVAQGAVTKVLGELSPIEKPRETFHLMHQSPPADITLRLPGSNPDVTGQQMAKKVTFDIKMACNVIDGSTRKWKRGRPLCFESACCSVSCAWVKRNVYGFQFD